MDLLALAAASTQPPDHLVARQRAVGDDAKQLEAPPAGDAGQPRRPKGGGGSGAFIAFSMPEIRRLIARFQLSSASTSFSLGRSGAGSIRPSPKPATGNDRPPNS